MKWTWYSELSVGAFTSTYFKLDGGPNSFNCKAYIIEGTWIETFLSY